MPPSPDTFRKGAGQGYYDVYEYLPGWRAAPLARRRSVLLGRSQVSGRRHRFFPSGGEWPKEFGSYGDGVEWMRELFRQRHGTQWEELAVPVRAGDASGRRTATALAGVPVQVDGLSNSQYRAVLRKKQRAEDAAARRKLLAQREHEEKLAADPAYRANVLYREFRAKTKHTHRFYYNGS